MDGLERQFPHDPKHSVTGMGVGVVHSQPFPANLPQPDDLAEEIIENLEAGLSSFRAVLANLNQSQ